MIIKRFYKQTLNIVLISILTSCSCNKKVDLDLSDINNIGPEENQLRPEVEIIDPFINNDIDYTQTITNFAPQVSLKRSKPKDRIAYQKAISKKSQPKSTKKSNKQEISKYDSGLKYEILRNGPASGQLPKKGQTITTHYVLWQDEHGEPGEQIDSTYDRGLPFEFKIGLGQVIRAWDEGIMDMRVGDKRRFYVPHELAWGQAGAAKFIPGSTDLIYEIEVLNIK